MMQGHRRSKGYTVHPPGDLTCQVHILGPSQTRDGLPGLYLLSSYLPHNKRMRDPV